MALTALPTLPTSPAVGDPAQASWADDVAAWVNFLTNPPRAQLSRSANQTIPTSVFTSVLWTEETIDNYDGHSTTVNTSRYTIQASGVYLVLAQGNFSGTGGSFRACTLALNGTTLDGTTETVSSAAFSVVSTSWVSPVLTAGDYIEFLVEQNSGGDLDLVSTHSGLTVAWLSAS